MNKTYINAYIEKANTYYALRDHVRAKNYFRKALKIDKKSPEALNGLGLIAVDQERYGEAIGLYNNVIGNNQDSDLAYIYENIGVAYYRIGKTKYNDALDTFDKAIAMNPKSVGAIVGKGLIFDERGNKKESDKRFAEAIDIDPNYVYLQWISKGVSFEEEGKYEEAIAYFNKSLKPNSYFKSLALINLGLTYLLQDKYNDSINYFDRAINIDSYYSALALVCKSSALFKLNDTKKAYECYTKALEMDENLEYDSRNSITYPASDGVLAFFDGYDRDLVGNLIDEAKNKANTYAANISINGSHVEITPYVDKVGNDSIPEINRPMLSDEELSEARRNAEENGSMGEAVIYNYLDYLTKIGKIKSFEWISKIKKYSPYDFSITDNNEAYLFIDVKSTDREFDQKFYISYGELRQMAYGEERYDIYRVYQMQGLDAKLRISRDLKPLLRESLRFSQDCPKELFPIVFPFLLRCCNSIMR